MIESYTQTGSQTAIELQDLFYAGTSTVAQRLLRIRTTPKSTETANIGDTTWCNLQSGL